MRQPSTHHYRGNSFAGLPCLDCGLSKEGPIHRVEPPAERSVTARIGRRMTSHLRAMKQLEGEE